MAYNARQNTYEDQAQYPPAQPFNDNGGTDFDPYDNRQPHRTYDQGGYGNDNGFENGYGEYRDDPIPPTKEVADRGLYDGDDIPPRPMGPKTPASMRQWRTDTQGNLWTRGSRGRCCGRFFCCTIMIVVFLFVSIVLALVLWIKPPNVIINEPTLNTSSGAVQSSSDGFSVNLDVNVSVNNPNYFSVDFSKIDASLFYPPNMTAIGGGEITNINFKSNHETNFTLPITLQYNITNDPNYSVLVSLAGKCGILPGTTASDIQIDYKLDLSFRVLVAPISPTISGSFNIQCPLTGSDISGLLSGAGLNLGDLAGLLGGSSS